MFSQPEVLRSHEVTEQEKLEKQTEILVKKIINNAPGYIRANLNTSKVDIYYKYVDGHNNHCRIPPEIHPNLPQNERDAIIQKSEILNHNHIFFLDQDTREYMILSLEKLKKILESDEIEKLELINNTTADFKNNKKAIEDCIKALEEDSENIEYISKTFFTAHYATLNQLEKFLEDCLRAKTRFQPETPSQSPSNSPQLIHVKTPTFPENPQRILQETLRIRNQLSKPWNHNWLMMSPALQEISAQVIRYKIDLNLPLNSNDISLAGLYDKYGHLVTEDAAQNWLQGKNLGPSSVDIEKSHSMVVDQRITRVASAATIALSLVLGLSVPLSYSFLDTENLQKIKNANTIIKDLSTKNEALIAQNSKITATYNELLTTLNSLQNQLETNNKTFEGLKKENLEIKDKLKTANREKDSAKEKNKELQNTINKLNTEISKLKTDLNTSNQANTELNKQLTSLQDKLKELKIDLNNKELQVLNIDTLKNKIKALETIKQELQGTVDKLTRENTILSNAEESIFKIMSETIFSKLPKGEIEINQKNNWLLGQLQKDLKLSFIELKENHPSLWQSIRSQYETPMIAAQHISKKVVNAFKSQGLEGKDRKMQEGARVKYTPEGIQLIFRDTYSNQNDQLPVFWKDVLPAVKMSIQK